MQQIRVLLVTPSFAQKGGVSEFNKLLVKYGKSGFRLLQLTGVNKKTRMGKALSYVGALVKLNFILLFRSVDIVHINPSLGKNSVYRDGNFVRIALFFRKKVFVHWHGWNPSNTSLLEGRHLDFFQKTFFRAHHIKVLSREIGDQLYANGYRGHLSFGNTFIDDQLLSEPVSTAGEKTSLTILFLSTVSENKGVYTALEAFLRVQQVLPECELIIAGNGQELEKVKDLVSSKGLQNIRFAGHVEGMDKRNVFCSSSVYIFPSRYEGMPTSVLEAMGLGLPVVCSAVGALPDFFEQGRMGYMLSSFDPQDYARHILHLLQNQPLREEIGKYNSNYARRRFLASNSVAELEKDYEHLLNGRN